MKNLFDTLKIAGLAALVSTAPIGNASDKEFRLGLITPPPHIWTKAAAVNDYNKFVNLTNHKRRHRLICPVRTDVCFVSQCRWRLFRNQASSTQIKQYLL